MRTKQIDPVAELRRVVQESGSQSEAARRLEVSGVYVHDLLSGKRGFSKRMLAKLGLRAIIIKAA